MKTLTVREEEKLMEAFSCMVNMSIATDKDNHSRCGSFQIRPFNTHWDKKTLKEVMGGVKIYIDTWVIPRMEEALQVKRSSVERYERKRHKEAKIRYNEWTKQFPTKNKPK